MVVPFPGQKTCLEEVLQKSDGEVHAATVSHHYLDQEEEPSPTQRSLRESQYMLAEPQRAGLFKGLLAVGNDEEVATGVIPP